MHNMKRVKNLLCCCIRKRDIDKVVEIVESEKSIDEFESISEEGTDIVHETCDTESTQTESGNDSIESSADFYIIE